MAPRWWRFGLLVATAFPMLASGALAQAPQKPDADPPAAQIVPLYVSTNRPLVLLTIGDSAPLPVVFDTGTDENILDAAYSKRSGLKIVGHSTVIDNATGKSLEVPVAATPVPSIGGVPLATKTVQLLDYRPGDVIGIFGPDSFGNDCYVIVEAGLNRLRIVPKNSGFAPPGQGHPYKSNLPAVEIRVGGQSHDAIMDSGNDSQLVLGGDFAKTVPLKAPAKVVGMARSALGEQEVLGGELAGSLVVGSYNLEGPDVTFSMPGASANIGFPVLQHLTIVLDPGKRRSWVLDPGKERPVWSDFAGRFGPRTIRLEDGKLIHQRDGRPAFELKYLGGDLFEMAATHDRIQFYRKDGHVIRLELITVDGQVAPAHRTS